MNRHVRNGIGAVVMVMVAAACATTGAEPVSTIDGEQAPSVTAAGVAAADSLVPPGYGTLRQDEVTVSIRSGALLVKVTPLSESVIRLLAPDTYSRLYALRESRTEEAARATMRTPDLFLVSFFSYEPDVSFQPEDVQIMYQSRMLRPAVVMPLTTGWGQQRLDQQATQNALYAFDAELDYRQVLAIRYGTSESQEWRTIVTRLENERGRILSRIR